MSTTRNLTLTMRLGKAWRAAGEGRCEDALVEAIEVRAEAEQAQYPDVVARANHHIAWFFGVQGRAAEGLQPILTARAIWLELGNNADAARAGATYAWILMEIGDSENAISESSDAMLLAEGSGSDDVIALASNTQALALILAGQLDSALPMMERAITLGRGLNDPHALSRWLINSGYLNACLGDRAAENNDECGHRSAYLAAVEINAEGLALAEHSGSAWYQRIALSNAAEYQGVLGNLNEAQALLARWEAIEGNAGDRLTIQFYYTQSEILTRAHRLEEARSVCEMAVTRAQLSGITLHELNAVRRLSDVHEAMLDHKEALTLFKRYHLLYKKFYGETAQRRARITEVLMETEKYKSLAMQAHRRADQFAADALLDPLTGIANRRALDMTLAQLDVDNSTYAIAIIDLDHFKHVNDNFSHMVGDDVLRVVADTLALVSRPTDLVARMGGEEFVMVFFSTSVEVAEVICQRVRTKLAAVDWTAIAKTLAVTASIGLASSDEDDSAPRVLALADRRLYEAKSSGRDRIVGRGLSHTLVN